jgi:CheY-like chemotaxis protein/tRNA A-37 threonylcarbamoyl transferase component Bud32
MVELQRKTRMATQLSRAEFIQNLSDSGLFTPEEVHKVLDTVSEVQAPDGDAVARQLVDAGKLTPFQVEAVRERRFEGLVIGNYQIIDRLGQGGMGTVYKARHRRMRRVVAIKILSRKVGQSEKFIKRFQREVEAVARLSHPNIVMAHDADEAEVGHFLVMEFVNGRDLASEVQKRGPLPVGEALDCIVQAARALEYAHGQGIIHRDIKPANLLRDVSGVVKVADLGLARFEEGAGKPEDASALTQAGTVMGTADFMSPEQAMGAANVDHRADIYSLGCTLHFLLLGKPPYEGPTMMAVLLKHRDGPIPSLAAARSDVPAELDAAFQRMLAKAPDDRPQTMSEVVRALETVQATLREQGTTPGAALVLEFDGGSTGVWENQTSVGAAPPQTGAASPAATPIGLALKILLVEPSRTQSGIIRKYLQAQGVQDIGAVPTGTEALQALRTERRDVIVCALHLSDMTGWQLAERIREENKTAPPAFVLISSEAESKEVGSLSRLGKALLLKKPFTAPQLGEALRLVSAGPLTSADARRTPPTSLAPPEGRARLRVLIVDDSAAARVHVRNVLTGLGLSQFVDAADGARAVAAMAGDRFDLIVTDYNMPYMDGRSLVAYLKQNPATAAVPVIMVTTEKDPVKLEAVRRLGVAAVCDKSFPAEAVRKIIDRLVPST